MGRRLKVLISAYACEPGKGSEPEVGWQWALQMARFHDVTVLTRANNQNIIETELARLRGQRPLPQFVYLDEGPFALKLKARFKAVRTYYVRWQHSARRRIAELLREKQFDLLHHVTLATFRYPTAIWGHGVPCVWGPIGGIESIPAPLLPWRYPRSLFAELLRNASNCLHPIAARTLARRAGQTTAILTSTREMHRAFARLGFDSVLMPSIGLDFSQRPLANPASGERPLKLLFVGNMQALKGIDLALEALAASRTNGTLTLFGDGEFMDAARRLAVRLGLSERAQFRGRLPREQILKLYPDYDVFLFPSLHDTGGYAVIEAMSNQLPVVCLDCGGPALAVQAGCGIKVPLGSRRGVISGLARAIEGYHQNRMLIATHGQAARESVAPHYDWQKKGEQMNEVYLRAVAQNRNRRSIH